MLYGQAIGMLTHKFLPLLSRKANKQETLGPNGHRCTIAHTQSCQWSVIMELTLLVSRLWSVAALIRTPNRTRARRRIQPISPSTRPQLCKRTEDEKITYIYTIWQFHPCPGVRGLVPRVTTLTILIMSFLKFLFHLLPSFHMRKPIRDLVEIRFID